MDQLKQFLSQVQKYHFWLLAVLAVVISLVGWFFAKNVLSADYKSGREKVKQSFDKTERVKSVESHPNSKWTEGVKQVTEKLKKRVFEAWNMVYEEQRGKVLHWPKALGADFEREVVRLGPFGTIPERLCEHYHDYINKEFVELLKIVHARSYDEKTVPTDEEIVKLQWDSDNQKRIYASLQWASTPTSPQVRNAQENLWVYEAILTVIAKINADAHDIPTSKIRAIETLSIGREAGEEFKNGIAGSRVWHASTGTAPANMPVPVAVANPAMRMGGVGNRMLGRNDAANSSVTDEGRYVNEQGKPIEAGAAGRLEFNRMPVHMKLIMDQREIDKLLVELANSPLPVDVRQVRLRPDKSYGMRPGVDAAPAHGLGRVIRLANDDDKNPYEMLVEIHGIIYIFSPPDNTKLGQPAEGSEQPAEGENKPAPAPAPATQAAAK